MTIRLENVGHIWSFRDGSRRALQSVNAEFESGIPHFICGPSGAGKSTLGLIASGLIVPTEGRVLANEMPIVLQRSRIAFLFQFPETIFFADSVQEELQEINTSVDCEPNESAFSQVGISLHEIGHKHPYHLSASYARLTALALQMSRQPTVFILDKPTIGLDWKHQKQVISSLKNWITGSRTMLVLTHDLDLLEALGGKTWIISNGKLCWSGKTADLLDDSNKLLNYGLLA